MRIHWITGVSIIASCALGSVDTPAPECIRYFDPARPPMIEQFEWHEGGWMLVGVKYDSDGDWFLDTTMRFLEASKTLTAAAQMELMKSDSENRIVRKDGARFVPFETSIRRSHQVYPRSLMYRALELDERFRRAYDGSHRMTESPIPAWDGNVARRDGLAYRNLVETLRGIKVEPPPKLDVMKKPNGETP